MTRIFALLAVGVVAIGGYFYLNQSGSTPVNPLASAANADEAAEIDTSSIVEMTLGADDAPVTIVEYASYTCPHCATFHEGPFKKLKADYIDTGKVKFVFRDVYFDKYGLWAAMVARCTGPEKFFGISDLIFKGQNTWARAGDAPQIVEELKKIGRLSGVDNATLEACLQDSEKAQTLVAWYQANAVADEVDSTPSFVINGKKVANQKYEDFAAIIDAELNN